MMQNSNSKYEETEMNAATDNAKNHCAFRTILQYCVSGLILLLLSVIVFIQLSSVFSKEYSATDIFNNSLGFVIEIKVTNDEGHNAYGTGVVYSEEGLVITNYHVVSYSQNGTKICSDKIEYRYSDEEEYRKLSFLVADEMNDVAILKIDDVSYIKSVATISTKKIKAGEKVYAVGNTSNYGLAISEGIVSVPLVNIEYSGIVRSAIQCDLTIAEGNSGGALLDSNGNLIGITTFRIKDSSGNIIYGIAYSIPIEIIENTINKVLEEKNENPN